jgi:hypothetical protein
VTSSAAVTTLRVFTDQAGVEWRISEMVSGPNFSPMQFAASMEFQPARTYLMLESERETRRLEPMPPAWQEATPEQLEQMLRDSILITIRRNR